MYDGPSIYRNNLYKSSQYLFPVHLFYIRLVGTVQLIQSFASNNYTYFFALIYLIQS